VIADLHCHYPMHLLAEEPQDPTLEGMVRVRRRPAWLDKLRAAVLALAARLLNFRRFSREQWRVDLDRLEKGNVRLVFSVLYDPFAEMDLDEWPGSDPEDGYFEDLVEHLDRVEAELIELDPERSRHLIVRQPQDLDALLESERVGIMHCVEGGFHLGGTVGEIEARVATLAERGVVYVTLAHLFWRKVATNAPALPFLSDRVYDRIFHQPPGAGLTPLGEAAVRAMYKHRVLIDISHMRQDAIDETFELVEALDHEQGADPGDFPVIATHAGYRFGDRAYMLSPQTIERIARRKGVVGLIMSRHLLNSDLPVGDPDDFGETVRTLRRHIDEIHGVAGSHEYVGIGSDLDGFIKPTVGGIDNIDDLAKLRQPLQQAYPDDAQAMLSGNALRVLRRALAGRG
jgi:microsomal dipeptidase-like Zn-dependent dipeptidase